jgi:hypothetical protein
MPDASVKGKVIVTEASPVTSRYSGKTGQTRLKEVAGKPSYMLAQRKAESLQWKTVKFSVGIATKKQCSP